MMLINHPSSEGPPKRVEYEGWIILLYPDGRVVTLAEPMPLRVLRYTNVDWKYFMQQ